MHITERERCFFDALWQQTRPHMVEGRLEIPCVPSLEGKRVLICSCGSGVEPVLAARAGARVFAFDISETAVEKAREMADHNGVAVDAQVMDFHALQYEDNSFDIMYGSAILHHVNVALAGREMLRCLKPGGIAYFHENSDRNPILRFLRRVMFGRPNGYQKQQFLFLKRTGDSDEYPLTEHEVRQLESIFNGHMRRYNSRFEFFHLLSRIMPDNKLLSSLLWNADTLIGRLFPCLKPYSFTQQILLEKPCD